MGWYEGFKEKHPDGHVILIQYWRDGEVIMHDFINADGGRMLRNLLEPVDRVTVEDYQPGSGFDFTAYGAKWTPPTNEERETNG